MDILRNQVRCYSWGSTTAIPKLLGVPPTGEPQAELWVGAHERGPSKLVRGGHRRQLDTVIAEDPVGELGADLAEAALAGSGRLPFLAKVLAVERPLSLQLHPRVEDARRGHARETAAGIAPDAGERSFPDWCAKPELVYAMSDFRAVCGFRPVREMLKTLSELAVDELRPVQRGLAESGTQALRPVLALLLHMPPPAVEPLISRVRAAPGCPDATVALAEAFPADPAVLVSLLLRSVSLSPGQTMYVAPGQLHCYLSGVACEVQANSDNVVRAGLTTKHVDAEQVLDLVDVSNSVPANVERSAAGAETFLDAGVAEFALGVTHEAPQWTQLQPVVGPVLLLCLDGEYAVDDGTPGVLRVGQSAYVSARAGPIRVRGSGTLLRVTAGRARWDCTARQRRGGGGQ